MKLGMAHPMGPLQLADFIGLDVCLAIMEVLYSGLGNDKYARSPLLVNIGAAGKKGVKSGEGFYDWSHGTQELIVASNFKQQTSLFYSIQAPFLRCLFVSTVRII